MAKPKKGTAYHVLFPMVDATDYAAIESAIVASDVSAKFYGVNQGQSAAGTTSGTVSRAASVVHSGVFRLEVKGTENNYDNMMVRIQGTGCAEQIVTWENMDYDDSDIYLQIAAAAGSVTIGASSMSDLRSAIAAVSAVVSTSDMSDIRSAITAAASDVKSAIAAGVPISASDMSD